ncbi:threonine-phosphate decarboxylase CobD [Oceanobacillus bengalensis]|uniref:threonine-phosphate decarboxylase n=1 Tax=Oceanobacillus bengalensis TaxID=1435466 RepID=A0A494YTH7_9BACI|nr:threonine-phosphate decarboxylase CobD [Oceanobacillus bengalensis]RKQ13424.1 threonine-phosphate decarboxylase [Oceanobacillus bengalensis]
MNLPQHGSNPQYIYDKMGIPKPDKWIDLSANINPLGPPDNLMKRWVDFYNEISDYPDPHALLLKKQIAKITDVDIGSILIGNGGSELITLLGRVFAGKNVLIIEPAFSEYEKVCRANDCRIFYHQLNESEWKWEENEMAEKLDDMDVVFLCNPNNPTGIHYPYSVIVKLIKECAQRNIFLIVDEAFYDFLEDYVPITPLVNKYEHLIILRSMTKMFAIPGLRLGYMLANQQIIEKLTTYQPHWSVNTLALLAGQVCLQDGAFVQNTTGYIRFERERLFSFFRKEGFAFSPSQVNFYLLRDPLEKNQLSLFEFLLRKGIVPRHTYNFPGLEGKWLRFAIKSTEENNQLMEVLKDWKQRP